MSLVKNSVTTFLAQVVIMATGLVCGVIMARFLGPEGKGAYELVFLPANLIVNVMLCGITVAPIYYIGKKEYERSSILANGLTIALAVSTMGILLFLCCFRAIYPLFFKEIKPYFFFIALLAIPTGIVTLYLRYFLMSINQVNKFNAVLVLRGLTTVFFIILFIGILKLPVLYAILAVCFSELISLAGAFLLVKQCSKIRLRIDKIICGKLLSYGMKSHAGQILDMICYRADVWMIAYFMDIRAVGFYSIALISQKLVTIPDSVGINLFRKLSNSNFDDSRTTSKIVVRNLLFVVFFLVLFFLIFGKRVILFLYGDTFLPSVVPFLILLPTVLLFTISKNLKAFLSGHGRPELASYASIFSFGTNVCLNYFLIPRWGINGAAFASSASVFVYASIILCFYLKISGNSIWETLIINKSDVEHYRNLFTRIKARFSQ